MECLFYLTVHVCAPTAVSCIFSHHSSTHAVTPFLRKCLSPTPLLLGPQNTQHRPGLLSSPPWLCPSALLSGQAVTLPSVPPRVGSCLQPGQSLNPQLTAKYGRSSEVDRSQEGHPRSGTLCHMPMHTPAHFYGTLTLRLVCVHTA